MLSLGLHCDQMTRLLWAERQPSDVRTTEIIAREGKKDFLIPIKMDLIGASCLSTNPAMN